MTRLIDADALEYGSASTGEYVFEYVPKYQIDNAPTIDAVQVVRCKDCFLYGDCNWLNLLAMMATVLAERKDDE